MARPRKGSGRVTPKGTHRDGDAPAPTYGRHAARSSPRWFGVSIAVVAGLGVAVIILNYLAALLPGSPSNWWLLAGLGLVLVAVVAATQYH
jgi:Cell division protein CrgA